MAKDLTGQRRAGSSSTPDWDAKIGLAMLFIIGYFGFLWWILYGPEDILENKKEIALVGLAALGPQLGQIFQALFRTTLADERTSERRSEDLRTAIVTPGAPTEELGDDVRAGARAGTREGVGDAMSGDKA